MIPSLDVCQDLLIPFIAVITVCLGFAAQFFDFTPCWRVCQGMTGRSSGKE